MKKIVLLTSILCVSTPLFAIQIEQRDLSSNNSAVGNVPATQQSTQFWELHQQIQQLQTQIRQLRGQIEEQDNQIDQLNNDLKNRYTDLDQRLEIINQKIDPDADIESAQDGETESTEQNSSQTTSSQNTASSTAGAQDTQLDEAAYNMAYEAYKQGGAAKAIAPMENFIKNHPNSPYVSHAYYWLGEFNLSLTPPNYNQAKDNFAIVAGNYPQSNKAPSALYRLSEIAKNIDKDTPKAREYYLRLIQKYPDSNDAKTARTSINL